MKTCLRIASGLLLVGSAHAAELQVGFHPQPGALLLPAPILRGVITAERAASPAGPWVPEKSSFTTGEAVRMQVASGGEGRFFRAAAVDLEAFDALSALRPQEILDTPSFASRLSSPAPEDSVAQFLGDQLSAAALDALFSYPGLPDSELLAVLVPELNRILAAGPIYEAGRFAGVRLFPSTLALLASGPRGADLFRLNRWLLEDAFRPLLATTRDKGFGNLVNAYGLLSTVAGSGNIQCSACNSWSPSFEGSPAPEAALSSPHIAMADRQGNIYIADKRAHAIRKVTPAGLLVTVAGTGVAGFGDTNPAPALSVALNNPNGIWVLGDGSYYILDRDNGLIRKVDTAGLMTTVVNNGGPIAGGRGLWVSPDESRIVFAAGSQLKRWDGTRGLVVWADGFGQLGNIAVDPAGHMVVTDSALNQVFQVNEDGTRVVLAGTGANTGGGDGLLAVETGLAQVRAICFLPTGGFFLGTDQGSQIWYVDTDGRIHLFLNGAAAEAYAGDGAWFYQNPEVPKVSFVKQITLDYDGNLLVTESDRGYVRRVQLLPHRP